MNKSTPFPFFCLDGPRAMPSSSAGWSETKKTAVKIIYMRAFLAAFIDILIRLASDEAVRGCNLHDSLGFNSFFLKVSYEKNVEYFATVWTTWCCHATVPM